MSPDFGKSPTRPDANTEERLTYLREQANESLFTEAARSEYEEFIDTLDFVGLLKARARTVIDSKSK